MLGLALFLTAACVAPQDVDGASHRAALAEVRRAETERALQAYAHLGEREQHELGDYLALEIAHQESFQNELIAFVLRSADKDRGAWPAASPAPYFDPAEHAPAQPIARKRLSADEPAAQKLARELAQATPASPEESAWFYDYATRGLVHTKAWKDSARVLRNALAGFAPDQDLATALVERALDDGSQQKVLAAFAHAYTDRSGNVYPNLTLYVAWGSHMEIEMPDVDCLGIVHDVLGDRTSWTAPVAGNKQQALYDKLGELYQAAHRFAGLRHALAACYLAGDAPLRDGYDGNLVNFHVLWDKCASTPGTLAPQLPDAAHWLEFLEHHNEQVRAQVDLWKAGETRRAALASAAESVRKTALRCLEEFGAFQAPKTER